jgi:hypothetical protein
LTVIAIRRATAADVPAIVALLADDVLGRIRESPDDLLPYEAAFSEINRDPQHLLLVADRAGVVIGTPLHTLSGDRASEARPPGHEHG